MRRRGRSRTRRHQAEAVRLDGADDPARFGNKAAALARASAAGLTVPDGFVLPSEMVEAVIESDPSAVAELERIHGFLPGPLVVRSSGVQEDSRHASFAGQHLSVLGVGTAAELRTAVGAVAASASARGPDGYRRRLGLGDAARGIAAIVQTLVAADVAGVLFTVDPLSGDEGTVIEANWGLGVTVCSGDVIPDRYRLDGSGDLLDCTVGSKRHATVVRGGAVVDEHLSEARRRSACLERDQLRALAELGRRCAAVERAPCDIEWAIAGGVVYLLQQRPISHT